MEKQQPLAKRQKLDNDDDDSSETVSHDNDLSSSRPEPQDPLVPLKSDFFNAACRGASRKINGTIHLPEQDPAVVNYFIHWICTGQLRGLYNPSLTATALSKLKQAAATAAKDLSYYLHSKADSQYEKIWTEKQTALNLANYRDLPLQQLVNLYAFADFAHVKGLKDAIVDAVVDAYGNPGRPRTAKPICFWDVTADRPDWLADPIKLINSAWEQLPADTPFRRVILNLYCDAFSPISGTRYATELCPAFSAAAFDRINEFAKNARQGVSYSPASFSKLFINLTLVDAAPAPSLNPLT
ncbi:MAG: hypothetical protein Q9215_003281 [Flavoplaca cf. flavocitrina]